MGFFLLVEEARFAFEIISKGFSASAASSDSGQDLTKRIIDGSTNKVVGGDTDEDGVVVSTPYNIVNIRDNATNDPVETTEDHQQVYGRVTATVTALAGTWTWDGTLTVVATDTSGVSVGDFIQHSGIGVCFEITSITANTSVDISNPGTLALPVGVDATSHIDLTISYLYEDLVNVEQPFTFLATQIIDFTAPESLAVEDAPFDGIQKGRSFQEILPATSLEPPRLQENIVTENIVNADVTLADQLDFKPANKESVELYLNGVFQEQGDGKDYKLVSGSKGIHWLAGSGTAVNMSTDDVLLAVYEKKQ